MTQSPADEYEKPVRTGGRTRQPPDSESPISHTLGRVRDGLSRCLSVLGRLVGADDARTDRPSGRSGGANQSESTGRSADANRPARHDRTNSSTVSHRTVDTSNDAVPELPARDRAFTQPPGEAADDNPPEPVATVEGTKLTVKLPDRPETSMTSDVWQRVER